MTRAFLYGTLRWAPLLRAVAGDGIDAVPAVLKNWHPERSASGDWPVLVPGGGVEGVMTAPLPLAALARLDWYAAAFGAAPEPLDVAGATARVYRAAEAAATGEAWALEPWIAAHGERALIAAEELMRALGRVPADEMPGRLGYVRTRAQGIAMNRHTRRPVTIGRGTEADAIEVHEVAYPYEGFHRVEEWVIDHPRFDGARSGAVRRAVSNVSDAATVLPWDRSRDRVLLVEQVRVGPLAKGDPLPWLLEPVAGLIDAGETAESTALREMEEESGLSVEAAALRFVGRYYPSPGGLAQVLHSYIALCDLPDEAAGLGGLDGEGEDIRTHLVQVPDLLAMVESGEAANAPLIVSAQWIALNRSLDAPSGGG
jgi:nudix-type nucleoside diphosphatase (YffH/AdpP family)